MKYLSLTLPKPNQADGNFTVGVPQGVPQNGDIIGNVPQFIFTVLVGFVIVASVAMIIFSGIQWITSAGDPKKIEGARGRLTYAIIGLVIALIATLIAEFTISLLGGDPKGFGL
jgi:hypothetical protein